MRRSELSVAGAPRWDERRELALIGCAAKYPGAWETAQRALGARGAEAFAAPIHQEIWRAMARLSAQGSAIDLAPVLAELVSSRASLVARSDEGQAKARVVLQASLFAACREDAAETVARSIADDAFLRGIERDAESLLRLARDPSTTASALRARAGDLLGHAATAEDGRGPRSFADLAVAFNALLEAPQDGRPAGLLTGFAGLDQLTGGLRPGQMIVLGARPRMGKSAFAINVLTTAAQHGTVLFVSLEMGGIEQFARAVCGRARVDASALRLRRLNGADLEDLLVATQALSLLPVIVDDRAAVTVPEVRSQALALRAKGALSLIVVDYLQLLGTVGTSSGNREQEVAAMSRGLKALARELEVPVLVLAQLNREVDKRTDHRPVLSDLRESGQLEQDADLVMFLYREEVYDPETPHRGMAELIVAKHRAGPCDTVPLRWHGAWTSFADLEARGVEDDDPGRGLEPGEGT